MQFHGKVIGLDQPFFLIAGPCVIESEDLQLRTAERLKAITDKLGILFIFKSSFDKANRSSDKSFRGPGMDEGLEILSRVRDALGCPILTDVHDIPQVKPVAEVVDVLQTPAFLARQTDFIHAVASAGNHDNNIYNNYWSETYHGLREVAVEEKKGEGDAKTDGKTDAKTEGVYACRACGAELFTSQTKFDSHCGWPSFFSPLAGESVELLEDRSLPGRPRTEVRCATCGSHLGHVFPDGPHPTGVRYCINSAALKLEEE